MMRESDFYKYMQFSTELLYNRYSYYLPYFDECEHILDLGCGHGVFLELLVNKGKTGLGVDIDEGMLGNCRKKNLDVVKADVLEFIEGTDQVFDGIFCAHLVEHFDMRQTSMLIEQCWSHLDENGILLIATPNPACLQTHLTDFWRDPSHIRMYTKDLLAFTISNNGFNCIDAGENTYNISAANFKLPSSVSDIFENDSFNQVFLEAQSNTYNLETPDLRAVEPRSKIFSPIKYIKYRLMHYIESCLSVFAGISSAEINRLNNNLQNQFMYIRGQIEELKRLEEEELKALSCLSPYPEIYVVGSKVVK